MVQALILFSVLGAVLGIEASHRFSLSADWILTLGVAFLGARLVTSRDREELEMMRRSAWKQTMEFEGEQDALEALRIRRERREAIRAGRIKDDGLTDWGRELAANPQLAENTKKFEDRYGIIAGAQVEDVFAVEARDKKVEAAWKRMAAAHEAWEKARKMLD